ncbi:DUF6055 domain-containing protein [Paenibacillus kribbensis]|uniref:DUF6055 domain-containing protein n=1 Tax=Paenibacillus kribbensis TaxID=172713 RepID=UPI002DBAB2C9|nr:DUF6055 domain-containing protein [Paenibacillus kribbensis]MEC0235018.1 DUF6055 domain-containing protein [Paenibacillus kribbensis]
MKKLVCCLLMVFLLLNVTSYGAVTDLLGTIKTAKAEEIESVVTTESTKNANEYKARDAFYSLSDSSVNRATSEHFQIIWGNNDTTGTVNRNFVNGNLANLESIRSFYMDKFGLGDIGTSPNPQISGKYKTNIYIASTGLKKIDEDWAYMSIDRDAFGYIVMMPAAMRVDPPSWVVPHELGHVFTYHNGGEVPYEWYEAVANFLRNEYLGSDYYSYGGTVYGPDSDFFAPFILNSESHFPHVKNWYDAWPILLYIHENPDHINGLGHQAMLNLLSYSGKDTTYFESMEKVTGVSIKELLGGMARRLVTMDFKSQPYYLKHLDELLRTNGNYEKIYTTLKSDKGGWLTVPQNKAPQQTGYNIVPLDIDLSKASVTVDFQGTSTAKGADWRASIVSVTHSGDTRYSTMWNKGKNSLKLQGDEKTVYLVVSATPDTIKHFNIEEDGETYPYKVKVTTK